MCKNCNSNCFEIIFDTCVGYTGNGVPQGSSIKDTFDELFKRIAALEEKLEGCDRCKEETSTPSFKGFDSNYSLYAAKIKNTAAQYSVMPTTDAVNFSFNLEGILNALPSDVKVVRKDVKVYGQSAGNTLLVNTDKAIGTFNLSPNKFPVNVDYLITLSSPVGTIHLSKRVPVHGGMSGTYSADLDVKDYTAQQTGTLTQEEFADEVVNRILSLERKSDSVKFPVVAGTENLPIREGSSVEEILQQIILAK